MRKQNSKVEKQGKAKALNRHQGRFISRDELIPSSLMEKMRESVEEKQKEEQEMPSDFWL